MNAETLFAVLNYGILPFWALLIFAPRSRATHALVHLPVVPLAYGATYAVLLLTAAAPGGGNMTSLAGIQQLFQSPGLATAGWVHYLVFDLFVGAWAARDARRRGIAHGLVVPCLLLTLLAGPVGLAAYLALRWFRVRVLVLEEHPAVA